MTVTIELIKELREKTNVGLSECKKALIESDNDIQKAIELLQKKGLASIKTKADRVAAEGLTFLSNVDNSIGYLLELNCETDFVTRNANFQELVSKIGKRLENSQMNNLEQFLEFKPENEAHTVQEIVNLAISSIGEKIALKRIAVLKAESGSFIMHYIHGAVNSNMGRIGVLLKIKSQSLTEDLQTLGKQIAMQVAAMRPEVVDSKNITSERLQSLIDSMVKKFYEETVLLEQSFIIDSSLTVKQALESFAKKSGFPVEVLEFVRYEVGEGV